MLAKILGIVMTFFYNICGNYGVAIILFTFFSKIILLPISIWVQKNSIKMVKMQPELNRIKINYFGDKDKIADETSKLYKKEKYNALVSIIPLIIQIVLLLGLAKVINNPMTYILKEPKRVVQNYKNVYISNHKDVSEDASSLELQIVEDIKTGNIDEYSSIKGSEKVIKDIKKLKLKFLGLDMSWIAETMGGISLLIPLIAGLSALIMCIGQNKMNVLQQEQSKLNQWGMLIFSVALSLYLGYFVPAGIALYWTFSNLFAVLLQFLLNIFINPKKYVDHDLLLQTQTELKELTSLDKKVKRTKEQIKKEKEDYKRFFKIANKHLVFYSESNGFYKYYKGIIEYILNHTNIVVHYITSDYNDNIFNLEKENKQIKAYYIEEKKLITMMMKMDADVVVMTMPDLENYHIKRSYVRKDITYVYIPHGIDSINLTQRYKSINAYDVFFASGKYQKEEAEATFKFFNLDRKIFEYGYTLLDDMLENYSKKPKKETNNKTKSILIAPSWQKDNICDLCLDELLNELTKNKNYVITLRPHPQEVRHKKEKFEALKDKYKDNKNIIIQTDFSNNSSILDADLLITDWSGICYEYAFTTKKPVLFIDTPMKVMNPNYKEIDVEPYTIWSREIIGKSIKPSEIDKVLDKTEYLLNSRDKYSKDIEKLFKDTIYNIGSSSEKGAKCIIDCVQEKIKERKSSNEENK